MSDTQTVTKTCLAIQQFSVWNSDGAIISPSNLELHEGEFVLLVGMSGSGKSLLTDLILGCLPAETEELEVEGKILVDGVDVLEVKDPEIQRKLGVVFQLQRPGLFDDLTVDENLAFAAGPKGDEAVAHKWRESLGLTQAPEQIAYCSGGQRQRVALARTLEHGADLVIYDEPTTGLDPRSIERTIQLIRENHRRLSLIITHDYDSLLGLADRVILIDPLTKTLQDVTNEADIREAILSRLEEAERREATEVKEDVQKPGPREHLKKRLTRGWARIALTADRMARHLFVFLLTFPAFLKQVTTDRRVRRAAGRSMLRAHSLGNVVFIAMAGALAGLVATFFTFDRMPLKEFSDPLVADEVLAGLGFAVFRIGGPLLTAILFSAKYGAQITALLGNMSYSRQTDALRLLGVEPRYYLLWPVIISFLIGTLLLSAIMIGVASGVSLIVFIYQHLDLTPIFWARHFLDHWTLENLAWAGSKTAISAVGAGLIAYDNGMTPKRSGEEIGGAIHRTILFSLLWVLFVHAGFSFIEF